MTRGCPGPSGVESWLQLPWASDRATYHRHRDHSLPVGSGTTTDILGLRRDCADQGACSMQFRTPVPAA